MTSKHLATKLIRVFYVVDQKYRFKLEGLQSIDSLHRTRSITQLLLTVFLSPKLIVHILFSGFSYLRTLRYKQENIIITFKFK